MTTLLTRLFSSVEDRKKTQFAWGINFAPSAELNGAQCDKIVWRKHQVLRKCQLEAQLNDAQTHLELFTASGITLFLIHWQYNNVPTKQEWEARHAQVQVHCDFRISPCAAGNGRIVLLSWN